MKEKKNYLDIISDVLIALHYITLHYISGGFRGGPRSGSLFRPYRARLRGPDRQVPFIAPELSPLP